MKLWGNRRLSASIIILLVTGILMFGAGIGFSQLFMADRQEPIQPATDIAVSTASADIAESGSTDIEGCGDPPAGWQSYTVGVGDTVSALAARAGVAPAAVFRANCLDPDSLLIAGRTIFLPPVATSTPCVAGRSGWERVRVRQGDTLLRLAEQRRVSVAEIIQVNCLATDSIRIGDELYLPALPTPTPTQTQIPLPTATATARPSLPTPVAVVGLPSTAASAPTTAPTVSVPTAAAPPSFGQPGPTGPQTSPGQSAPSSGQSRDATDSNQRSEPLPSNPTNPFVADIAAVPRTLPSVRPDADDQFERQYCPTSGQFVDTFFNPLGIPEPLDIGARRYFFTCNFVPTAVTVTRSDGVIQPIGWYPPSPPPHPELLPASLGMAGAVLEWVALPFYPTGPYTLTVVSGTTSFAQVEFKVSDSGTSSILTVPPVGSPGTDFTVYYVNYPLGHSPEFQLFRETSAAGTGRSGKFASRWRVDINQPLAGSETNGWGMNLLNSNTTDITGTYVISEVNGGLYDVQNIVLR